MKRFVFIPFSLKDCEDSFLSADKIAKEAMLPIRIGDKNEHFSEDISIISIPQLQIIDCDPSVRINFIHSIDVTDEYVDMNQCECFIFFDGKKEKIKPNIKEKHSVRIRKRYNKPGNYIFFLEKDNDVICSGEFTVYES